MGAIDDPYFEFIFCLNPKFIASSVFGDLWQQKYSICKNQSIKFFRDYEEKAFSVGKYIDILRDCKWTRNFQDSRMDKTNWQESIDGRLKFVSETLMTMLSEKYSIEKRFE